jgi:ribosome maturation factor RimP
MKIYQIHYSTSKHKQKLRLAADTPQSLEITDFSRTYHLRTSVLFLFFSFWDEIYQIHYSASKHIQKLRLVADTPQSLEITELSRAHHLRSSVLFLFFSFWDENISDTLFSIQTYSKAEIGS